MKYLIEIVYIIRFVIISPLIALAWLIGAEKGMLEWMADPRDNK